MQDFEDFEDFEDKPSYQYHPFVTIIPFEVTAIDWRNVLMSVTQLFLKETFESGLCANGAT